MQQGLAQWLSYLTDKQLPILPRTKSDVQALINQPQLSITQYSAPVVYDAGFSAHVFCHVNTQRDKSGKRPLTTMGNALSHLGQAAFQAFLNETPLLESLKLSDKNHQGYLRVMGQACHAALQATEWAQQRNVTETEETQLSALLQSITELMLWCYGADVMPRIEELCYVKKQSYEQAAESVLGCGMRELGAKLAVAWNLPEMAILGLTTEQTDFTLATGVSLSSELSRTVSLNWYGKNAAEVIKRIAKYKGKTEGEIERRLHLNAVNVNDILIDRGYASPAKLLFQLADDEYEYPQYILETNKQSEALVEKTRVEKQQAVTQSEKNSSSNLESNKVPASRDAILKKIKAKKEIARKIAARQEKEKAVKSVDKLPAVSPEIEKQQEHSAAKVKKTNQISQELAASVKKFQEMVSQAKPAHDLIEHAVKMCLLCGVQRCVFFIKLPGKELLVSRYQSQETDDIAIKSLKIPMNKPHAFKLLMEKSRGLFLNESNISKYWSYIPDTVKLVIGVKSFFAMSIFVNNHAMGLMYADKVKGVLTKTEFVQFQKVCHMLSKGIAQSAQHKKNKS